MDEALAFSPAVVIEAFYAGNDLFDSFDLVYNRGQLPELKSADPDVRRRVAEAERKEPLADRAMRMLRMGTAPAPVRTKAPARVSAWEWIAGRSRIVGLFRALARERPRAAPQPTPEQAWDRARRSAERHAGYCQILENGEIRTILTSEYRLTALDLGDARIEEGLRISLAAMRRMRERTAAKGIRFLVVLIPTKEAVFRDLCPNPSESHRRLVENEDRVWTLLKESLDRDGIEYADALPVLRARLAAGIQPYPMSHDGHPNAAGHRAIAELVAALVVERSRQAAAAPEEGR
jgi:hypothetical protein